MEKTPFTEQEVPAKKLKPHQKLPLTVQEFGDVVDSVKASTLAQIAAELSSGKYAPTPELGMLIMTLNANATTLAQSETPSERLEELQQYDKSYN